MSMAKSKSNDPLQVAANVYTLVMENEKVRVLYLVKILEILD